MPPTCSSKKVPTGSPSVDPAIRVLRQILGDETPTARLGADNKGASPFGYIGIGPHPSIGFCNQFPMRLSAFILLPSFRSDVQRLFLLEHVGRQSQPLQIQSYQQLDSRMRRFRLLPLCGH